MGIKQLFKDTQALFLRILKQDFWLIVFFFLFTEIMQRLFLQMKAGGGGRADIMIMTTMWSMTLSLCESLLLCLLIPLRSLQNAGREPLTTGLWEYMVRYTKPLTLEGIRAFAKVLLWFSPLSLSALIIILSGGTEGDNSTLFYLGIVTIPLFALPAFIKFIRYSFVPFVVVENPAYDKGEIDALKESDRTMKGVTWQIFMIFVVLALLEAPRATVREKFIGFDTLHISFSMWLFALIFVLFMNVLLFQIYRVQRSAVETKS